MRMTQKLERGLRSMCNLSEGILERGIEMGLMQGQEKRNRKRNRFTAWKNAYSEKFM